MRDSVIQLIAGFVAILAFARPLSAETSAREPSPLVALPPEVELGENSVDGQFRVHSFAWPRSIREPARALLRQYTPRYPEERRLSRGTVEVRVHALVDSTGRVALAVARGSKADAAFDSSAVRAARAWRWEPSWQGRDLETLSFQFDGRPITSGVGGLLLVVRDSVSGAAIPGVGLKGPARDSGVVSVGDSWTRLREVPAGESKLVVSYQDFRASEVAIHVTAGREDTVTVDLSPGREIPAGHTFWTRPPAAYPDRALDDTLRAATDFAFIYEVGEGESGTRVDSDKGTATITSGAREPVTIPIELTARELDRVRQVLVESRFFDDLQPPRSNPNRIVHHDGHYSLEATLGGRTRFVSWKWSSGDMNYPSDDWKRLRTVIWLVEDILAERPDYVTSSRRGMNELPIDGCLDLHTFLPKDVPLLVPDYLEACRERGILEVRIVHGKGTGALRETVHATLRRMEMVEEFDLAPEARGGWGATVVRLRPPSA